MEETLSPLAATARKPWLAPAWAAAVIGAVVMGWIWWSFYALSQSQTYEILHTSGEVRIQPGGDPGASENLAEGTVLKTGNDGFVTLSLSEGSTLKLLPNTRATLTSAKSNRPGDRHESAIDLDIGEITSRVTTGDDRSRRVSLTTKAVDIAVRGTVFTVTQGDHDARLMVTEGRVFASGAEDPGVTVSKNQGTVIRRGSAPLSPVDLAPPPEPISAAAASANAPDGIEFVWRPHSGISRWQLEIALDEAFSQLVTRIEASNPSVSVAPLQQDGPYFWRVASVDSLGLRGVWSRATPFEHDYYYQKGRQALHDLNPDDAVAFFSNAQGNYDAELELLRARGWKLLEKGELEKAKQQFETVVAVRDNDSAARYGLGVAEMSDNDLAAAEKQFNAAVRDDPANMYARIGLAVVAVRSGKFEEGLALTGTVLEFESNNVPALQVASMAAVGIGDHRLARTYLEKILGIDANDPTALALSQALDSSEGVEQSLSNVKSSVMNAKPVE